MRFVLPVSRPIAVELPAHGVFFAESVHDVAFEMPWRRDPFHKVVHVIQGTAVLEERAPERATELVPGALTVIPAGAQHRLRDVKPAVLRLLCLSSAFPVGEPGVADIWTRLARRSPPLLQLRPEWQLRLESLWHRAVLEQVNRAIGHAAMVRMAAVQVLVLLARLPSEGGGNGGDAAERVDFVVRELEASFFDEWTLDRAAAAAKMSRRSFSAHFHRRTGHTFVAHLSSLRLEHAAKLLAQGNHSIVGAALAAGFSDVSHFHRRWRRHYGTTPKAWARGR